LLDHFDLYICQEIYIEYEYVILTSNLIDRYEAIEFLKSLKGTTIFCKIAKILDICRDKSDNKFLEVALETSSDYLVTKNIRHYPLKEYKNVKIVKVSKVLEALEDYLLLTKT